MIIDKNIALLKRDIHKTPIFILFWEIKEKEKEEKEKKFTLSRYNASGINLKRNFYKTIY